MRIAAVAVVFLRFSAGWLRDRKSANVLCAMPSWSWTNRTQMHRKLILAVASIALLTAAADAADKVCALTEQQAAQSPQCVRWYFTCKYTPGGKPTGPAAALDPATRRKFLAYITFRDAQSNCDIFSYQEALAAIQANTLIDERN